MNRNNNTSTNNNFNNNSKWLAINVLSALLNTFEIRFEFLILKREIQRYFCFFFFAFWHQFSFFLTTGYQNFFSVLDILLLFRLASTPIQTLVVDKYKSSHNLLLTINLAHREINAQGNVMSGIVKWRA